MKILYEWMVPAGCGYACRIIEIEPGIVRTEQRRLLDEEAYAAGEPEEPWQQTDKPMGFANELIHLWHEVEDWRESARKAAEEPCGDAKHCTCVGPLRGDIRKLENRLHSECSMSAKAIARASRAEERIDYLTDALRAEHGLGPLPKEQADFRRVPLRRVPLSELEDRHNRHAPDNHRQLTEEDLRLLVTSLRSQLQSVLSSRDATSDALMQVSREKAQLRAIADEERNQKQRWYEAAGQRQDELNEAHRALAWVCMDLPLEAKGIPAKLRPPEFVARQVGLAKAQYPTRISTLDEWWRCPECGPGVAGDEDGCCADCGADLEIEHRSAGNNPR